MKKVFTLLWLCFSLVAVAQQWVPQQVLVQLKHGADVEAFIGSFNRTSGMYLTGVEKVSPAWNIWLLTVTGDEAKAVDILYSREDVQQAQLNHYLKERSTVPNDSNYFMQWSFENIGQSGGLPGADIQAEEAWDYSTGGLTALGDTIVVAVVDGGADITHNDLKFWKNYAEIPNDGQDNDANGYIDDYNGWNAHDSSGNIPPYYHGTHISGIIGAIGNNNRGVAGVSWNVQIMPVVVLSYTDAEVMRCYAYVFDSRRLYNQSGGTQGAFVVATNSSFGVDFANPANYPLWCSLYDSMGREGILSAGSTANANVNVDASFDMPTSCSSDYLITVTNTTRTDQKHPACGYGATTVDLGAPGTTIYSTVPGNSYANSTGTSMSAPHVAGAIALLFAAGCDSFMYAYRAHPDSIALRIKDILLESTDTLASLQGITVSGGRLNVYRSLRRLLNEFCVSCVKVDVDVLNIACNGDSTGGIELLISSGIPPYTVQWSTGDTGVTQVNNLIAGSYNAEVTDSLGCMKAVYLDITEPTVLQSGFMVTRETDTLANGAINTTVVGGNAPYSFQWDDADSSTTEDITALSEGTYHVTITDSNGCFIMDTIAVQRDSTINVVDHITDAAIRVYPNPSQGVFTIEVPVSMLGSQIAVMDITGRSIQNIVLSSVKQQLSLQELNKGVYYLKVKKGSAEVIRKLILL